MRRPPDPETRERREGSRGVRLLPAPAIRELEAPRLGEAIARLELHLRETTNLPPEVARTRAVARAQAWAARLRRRARAAVDPRGRIEAAEDDRAA